MSIQPRIDKTVKMDVLELQEKFANLFEDNPISLEEFENSTGEEHKQFTTTACYITYSTRFLARFLISEFSLEHVLTIYAAERIVLATFKDWAVIRKMTSHRIGDPTVQELIFQGIQVKRDKRLIKASREDNYPYHQFVNCDVIKSGWIEGIIKDSGYYDAVENAPCCITDYILKPVQTWANDPEINADPIAVKEREQELRARRSRDKVKQEIIDGIRHEDGSLVNPGRIGRPALLTSEERVKSRRESQRRYKEKCRLKEIEDGVRNPDGSLVQVDREKPGPKPKFKDPAARIAHEKALRLKRKQARIKSEIEAGIRDADGKLIK